MANYREFWDTQIRCLDDENQDSTRDYLHDDSPVAFPYRSKEEALAMLPHEMDALCAERAGWWEEDENIEVSWHIVRNADGKEACDYDGNGFWFRIVSPDGEVEGRALVRAVRVPV